MFSTYWLSTCHVAGGGLGCIDEQDGHVPDSVVWWGQWTVMGGEIQNVKGGPGDGSWGLTGTECQLGRTEELQDPWRWWLPDTLTVSSATELYAHGVKMVSFVLRVFATIKKK